MDVIAHGVTCRTAIATTIKETEVVFEYGVPSPLPCSGPYHSLDSVDNVIVLVDASPVLFTKRQI